MAQEFTAPERKAIAEAPAMLEALRKVAQSPMAAVWLERDGGLASEIRAILARIDGATPTAEPEA